MKELEELTADIREKLPRLKEIEKGVEIFVPKNYDLSEWFSYTVINVSNSNSYLDVRKPWEGEKNGKFTKVITVKNNAISYELERYALKDLRYYGKEPMLNDVLEWLTILDIDNISVEFSNREFCIVKDDSYINYWDDSDFEGVCWDLSRYFLKDQSPELINFLHSLIKTKQ